MKENRRSNSGFYIASVVAIVCAALLGTAASQGITVSLLIGVMAGFLVYVLLNVPERYRLFGPGQIQQAQDNWAGRFGEQYPEDLVDSRPLPRVDRNGRCPCGSGKKYKNCHGTDEITS